MKNPTPYLARELPPSLAGLAALALDLRWSWNQETIELFFPKERRP